MSSKDAHLYGAQRSRNINSGSELSTRGTLSFASNLSALIDSSATSSHPRPARGSTKTSSLFSNPNKKEDIFQSHKRAKLSHDHSQSSRKVKHAPITEDSLAAEQKHSTHGEAVESDILMRSRRKMQQKARLYAAMQRGDLEDATGKYSVDFDTKWAKERHADQHDSSSGEDSVDDEDRGRRKEKHHNNTRREEEEEAGEPEPLVEYIDEFGRTRTGTRLERAIAQQAQDTRGEVLTARPRAPEGLIYGDAIQASAFNPDTIHAEKMASLAAKRDRSLTPPPAEHFDSNAELRTRGTGFMAFDRDEDVRQEQIRGLEEMRSETERVRAERDAMLAKRKAEVERRREEVLQKRAERMAGKFLADLAKGEIQDLAGASDRENVS